MRRTKAQQAFDDAVRGWAFCDARMLRNRIEAGSKLLPPHDEERRRLLDTMRDELMGLEAAVVAAKP